MALDKVTLKNMLLKVYNDVSDTEIKPADAREYMAKEIADAIEQFVKSGTVTVSSGIPVSTAGTAASQTGATTAAGTGKIS